MTAHPWRSSREVRAETLAREHYQRAGWYSRNATSGYVKCPRSGCRAEIWSSWHAWAKPTETRDLLVAALAEHLLDEHPSRAG